jgi:hypothetical protein
MLSNGTHRAAVRRRRALVGCPPQSLHFALILADVSEHRLDLRQQIESVNLQELPVSFAEMGCVVRHAPGLRDTRDPRLSITRDHLLTVQVS